MFTFDEDDLARDCVDTQLLIRSGAGLVVGWSSCPERKCYGEARPRGESSVRLHERL